MESDLNGGFTNRAEVSITTEEELKDSDSEDESILSDDQFSPNHLKITNSSCRILWKKKWKNDDARKLMLTRNPNVTTYSLYLNIKFFQILLIDLFLPRWINGRRGACVGFNYCYDS